MVEGTGFENRHRGNLIVSSNLTISARKRNQDSREKMRRREAPMIGLNSRQTQTPPGFSTLRVAQKVRFDSKF